MDPEEILQQILDRGTPRVMTETMTLDAEKERAHTTRLEQLRVAMDFDINRYTPGMFLKWHPDLCNRKTPYLEQPVVLLRHVPIDQQTRSDTDPGSDYYNEMQNAVIGYICARTGIYREVGIDLRRFVPYEFKHIGRLQ